MRELVTPKAGETWLLVTSAYHMPRAVGVFLRHRIETMADLAHRLVLAAHDGEHLKR